MRAIKLSGAERAIEQALLRGEYVDVGKSEFEAIAEAIARRRKDAALNIRVNSRDLIPGAVVTLAPVLASPKES